MRCRLSQIKAGAPLCQLALIEHVRWRTGAVEEHDVAVLLALGEEVVNHRAQRRQANATRDQHHIFTGTAFHRPVAAKRTPQAEGIAPL